MLVMFLLLACSSSEKSKDVEEIDLSNWRLTLPVDTNDDGKPDNYWPEEMEQALESGALKPFFYKDSDGAIVFYCEMRADRATTPNSKYPRTELREHIEPRNYEKNWTLDQGGRLSGILQVTRATPGSRFMVMQIHGRLTREQKETIGKKDNDAPPLLKIYYNDDKLEVAHKVLKNSKTTGDSLLIKSNWTDAEHYFFDKSLANNPFELEIVASRDQLEVILDGNSKKFTAPDLLTWPFENYFKAGNYLTTRDEKAFSEVKFYHLSIKH